MFIRRYFEHSLNNVYTLSITISWCIYIVLSKYVIPKISNIIKKKYYFLSGWTFWFYLFAYFINRFFFFLLLLFLKLVCCSSPRFSTVTKLFQILVRSFFYPYLFLSESCTLLVVFLFQSVSLYILQWLT